MAFSSPTVLPDKLTDSFGEQVIKSKTDKNKHVQFTINDKFKKIYILIKDSVYIPGDVCNEPVEFKDDDVCEPTDEDDFCNHIFNLEHEDPNGLDYGL